MPTVCFYFLAENMGWRLLLPRFRMTLNSSNGPINVIMLAHTSTHGQRLELPGMDKDRSALDHLDFSNSQYVP